ncbi:MULTISPECIES: FAD-dependent oxidoreductase [Dyella]|uniref:FAD-dependent monooxygenase n=2 Tax=Dyella TaxID=231454 RepID=A0A4R0YVI1_9GAMM|nr:MULTISPECIES: NAD(P)/FAD-dependent oxidoreductase [Dyella]TBR38964.1 FAD-dependent monooxygenase [Dyella terrae]TCI13445.1 FAD-dependent monooxygenase [Dyella soli]
MRGPLRIAIVGYGAAGQAAALFLSAQGHALSVFEQAPSPGPVGAGFLLQPTGLRVLARLGLHDTAVSRGQRITRLHGATSRGRTVMDMRYQDHDAGCFGLGLTRGSLFTILRDAYADASKLHTGVCMESIAGDGAHLLDTNGGAHGPFDLIVAADGAHSRLRQNACLHVKRQSVYPWGAMWCLLPAEDWPHADELRQRYAGTREMIGLLPVGHRADREGRWLTFYFSLPGARVDAFDGDALERLRARVAAMWPEARSLLDHVTEPAQLHRARYRDVVLSRPVQGRTVFLGDAAHAMSPQLGQGVNMALLDAEALADALETSDNVGIALEDYRRRRHHHLAAYQAMSRWLTPLFQSDRTWLGRCRDLAFGPLGRMPLARGQMLKILTGTKKAWWR